MATGLTTEQLEFLGARHHQHQAGVRFETIEACRQEDKSRAAALREFDENLLSSAFSDDENDHEWLFESSAEELATLLEKIADPDRSLPAPPCLASSVYLRNRRIGVLGAVLELVAAHSELDRAWFTGRHPALQISRQRPRRSGHR